MVDKLETRVVAGQTLLELGEEFPDLVVLGGDLNKSTHANKFGAAFPDRFFDFGPAEQNIVSVAAGMAASGKVPVVSTFAVFATSRPYDQLRVGVAQSSLNVKVIATHAGIITGEDGVSAHSIEDIAIMSALPSFTVIVPSDGVETVPAIRAAIEAKGPFYIRLSRPATPVIHPDGCDFWVGKAETLREGGDATIVACGVMVHVGPGGRRGAGPGRDRLPSAEHVDREATRQAGCPGRRGGDGRDRHGGRALCQRRTGKRRGPAGIEHLARAGRVRSTSRLR